MYRPLKSFVWILSLFVSLSAYSQSNKPGAWGILTVILPSDTVHRFGGYIEGKVQTNEISFHNFYHNEIKGGISYAYNNNYIFLIGGGRYTTFDYTHVLDGPVLTENRIWEQLTFTSNLGRIFLEHRYRAEQRWLNKDYRTSFRYRLNAVIPFNHKQVQRNTLYMSVFDEISLGLKAYSFERNRMSASLGFQFYSDLAVQAGWIFEDNNSLVSHNEKHNLLINLIFQIARKNPDMPAEK